MLWKKVRAGKRLQQIYEGDARGDRFQAVETGEIGVRSAWEAQLSRPLPKLGPPIEHRIAARESASRRKIPSNRFSRSIHSVQQRTPEAVVDQLREEFLVNNNRSF